MSRLGALLTAASLCAVPAPSPTLAQNRVALDLAVGRAITGRPEDGPGDVTLLYGSAFAGPAFRAAAGLWHALVDDVVTVSVGGELGLARLAGNAFAEVELASRSLDLTLVALEPLAGIEVSRQLGVIEPFALLAAGPRIGLSAKATERRYGFADDQPAPEIRVGNGLVVAAELGLAFDAGGVRIPISGRVEHDVLYPSTTADRLDRNGEIDDPGAYLVGFDFVFTFGVGVDFDLP